MWKVTPGLLVLLQDGCGPSTEMETLSEHQGGLEDVLRYRNLESNMYI